MASMDVFSSNAFSLIQLTNAMELAPHKPRMLESLGLFKEIPIYGDVAWIDKKNNRLRILNTAVRGTVMDVRSAPTREAVPFKVPHVPYHQTIIADDIMKMRKFGSESELETIASYVNDQLKGMKQDHEVTWEWHRIGALKGIILDGDGTRIIHNLFTAFGFSQTVMNWYSNDDLHSHYTTIIRTLGDLLGDEGYTGIIALCGNTYFDKLTAHPTLYAAYDRWRNGEYLRVSHLAPQWFAAAAAGFMYQNILFINFRGKVGDLTFVEDNAAYFIPQGLDELFEAVIAPADYTETVNTKGRKYYARQEPLRFNKGVELETQSNVLHICKRPDIIIKDVYGGTTNPSSSSA